MKLLRVIQERVVQPLGSGRSTRIDVRVIAAANQSLEAEVRAGRFREDLYYRLSEFKIEVPPLRKRREDIHHLTRRFVEEASVELQRPVRLIREDAAELLASHKWPGNVRQLRNVIREAVLCLAPHSDLQAEHLRGLVGAADRGHADNAGEVPVRAEPSVLVADEMPSLREVAERAVASAEREAIVQALRLAAGNKTRAARLLQTDAKTLHSKIKRLGIGSP
jgi:two-component system, NtrC family, response regulator HydG